MEATTTLSSREFEIVGMITGGKTKKEIAEVLHMSVRTVENHTRSAFKKTGCRKSTELVAWYMNNAQSAFSNNKIEAV